LSNQETPPALLITSLSSGEDGCWKFELIPSDVAQSHSMLSQLSLENGSMRRESEGLPFFLPKRLPVICELIDKEGASRFLVLSESAVVDTSEKSTAMLDVTITTPLRRYIHDSSQQK
jgi:hypothetical protein